MVGDILGEMQVLSLMWEWLNRGDRVCHVWRYLGEIMFFWIIFRLQRLNLACHSRISIIILWFKSIIIRDIGLDPRIWKHVRENIFGVFEPFNHLLICWFHRGSKSKWDSLMFLVHIGDDPILIAQNYLCLILEYYLDYLVIKSK